MLLLSQYGGWYSNLERERRGERERGREGERERERDIFFILYLLLQ